MDRDLEDLVAKAASRGNRYFKGEATINEIPGKLAELGVFLLERANTLALLKDDRLRVELIDIQDKLDDMRKVIFAGKLLIK